MVKHLPPAVKQLLTLRNPNSFAGPPAGRLYGVLNETFTDAKQRQAETGWLVLSVSSSFYFSPYHALSSFGTDMTLMDVDLAVC